MLLVLLKSYVVMSYYLYAYSPFRCFLMRRRPPRSTLLTHSFPTRRSSDLSYCICATTRPKSVMKRPNTPASFMRRRSEEHTSELQSLMRISYAVFCLKKTKQYIILIHHEAKAQVLHIV